MASTLQKVKRELGQNAVILGTRETSAHGVSGLVGRRIVEITAGPPGMVGPAPTIRGPRGTPAALQSDTRLPSPPGDVPGGDGAIQSEAHAFYTELVQNEVAEDLAQKLLAQVSRRLAVNGTGPALEIRALLRDAIASLIPTTGGIDVPAGAVRRVALVGPPGAGKTTALAKLAAHFKLRERKRVALLSLDMHRLGTQEQLRRYAEIIEVPINTAQTVAQAVDRVRAFGLETTDLVLIDTPGAGIRETGRFARLSALLRATRPDEVHLVLPASTATSVQERIAKAFEPLGVSRVMLTRLDEAVGFGVVLNAMSRVRWKLSYVSDGQNVPKDIEAACATHLAELILPPDQGRSRQAKHEAKPG